MPSVSASDLRQVIGFVRSAPPATPADPIPTPTLGELRDLIPCDYVTYFEMRRADRALFAHAWAGEQADPPGVEEAVLALGHQNPLNWRRWHPAHGPLRLSEVISPRELERLDFYRVVLEPLRIRDVLKVWLWSSPMSAACIEFNRDGPFSRREQDLLAVLQRHLIEMRERALASASPLDDTGEIEFTPREAEILSWVARGHSNEEIATIVGIATSTVRKHLEHAFEKLGVRSRAEAVWRLNEPQA